MSLKKLKNIIFFLFILICYGGICYADLRVFTDVREVELSKSFVLTVEASEDIDFKMPKMSDFVVILKSTNKSKGKVIYNYELSPKEEGIFTIPSITYGQSSSIPISIRVYKKQATKENHSYKDSNSSAEASVDTKIVYVNQVLYYTLKFKTNRDLGGNPNYILPMFQDFWKGKSATKSGYKLINGENYFTFEVSMPLYPIRDGTITIEPSNVTIQYLNSSRETKLETKEVNVKVLPLPNFGKPETFSGTVGRYDIFASVNKKSLKVNEPVVLTITIRGNGNINTISEPKIDLPEDIKKYSTTVRTKMDDFISSKEFQCVLIPLMDGEKIIPQINFSYFDPDVKGYREIHTNQITINVSGEKNAENIGTIEEILDKANNDSQETEEPSKELIIKTKIDTSTKNNILLKNKVLISFIILLLLAMVVALIYRIRLIIISKDVVRMQKMRYTKLFTKYFQASQEALSRYMQFKFYYNTDLALKMLLSSKTNCNYTFMAKYEIKQHLSDLKFDKQFIDTIMKIFVDCDKFKFTCFVASREDMNFAFSQLKFIKEQLDKIS